LEQLYTLLSTQSGHKYKYIYKGGRMNFEWKRFVVAFLAMIGFFFIAVFMC